ncbi:MAG: SdiA-regulated domain-containing protein [Ginsengibacter sp.]
MFNRYFILFFIFFIKVHAYQGCVQSKNNVVLTSPDYDLGNPKILKLNDALAEISGIYFYAKDSSVFGISDESGNLYKIHLNKPYNVIKWKFSKSHDYEDLVMLDDKFYILTSNGDITTLKFSARGDTIYRQKDKGPVGKNEFESLYYDPQTKNLVLICKDCPDDKKSSVSSFNYDPELNKISPSNFKIETQKIAEQLGDKKIKFKPSAAAINPITGDLWILSAVNQILVTASRDGIVKNVYTLNPTLYTQPEGITFTPWGDLLISNEAGDKYNQGTIFILKLKKKSNA